MEEVAGPGETLRPRCHKRRGQQLKKAAKGETSRKGGGEDREVEQAG